MRVMKNPFCLMLSCSCRLSSVVSFGPYLTLPFLIFTIIMIKKKIEAIINKV
jgi:hypothetical protein